MLYDNIILNMPNDGISGSNGKLTESVLNELFQANNVNFHHFKIFFDADQDQLTKAIPDNGVSTLLVECHTFSNKPNVLQPDPDNLEEADICLGFNYDWSNPEEAIPYIVIEFERRGYRVRISDPFNKTDAPKPTKSYHSIILEFNNRLFINELTGEKNESSETLQNAVGEVLNGLL